MARSVVSLVRAVPGSLRPVEPALEANAYAVAEDLDVRLVLAGEAVELAVARGESAPGELAGVAVAPNTPAQDLRGLIESGVAVRVVADDLAVRGLAPADLADGVAVVDADQLAVLLREAEAVLTW